MCRHVHRSLKPGGEEAQTGPRFRVTALLDSPVEITSTAPRREVYEHCLRAAGFCRA
ncbi:hypothetical protein [Streptomyces sp. NPDC001492]